MTTVHGNGHYTIAFDDAADVGTLIERHGEMPLPPYIRRPDGPLPLDRDALPDDLRRARRRHRRADRRACTSPTSCSAALRRAGVGWPRSRLHVGPGTFLPVRADDVARASSWTPEWCEIPATTAEAIAPTKAAGGRVVAVGTTTTRALESAAAATAASARRRAGPTASSCPGYRFRVVDALFTNFHLPGSTLLMLVGALRRPRAHARRLRRSRARAAIASTATATPC